MKQIGEQLVLPRPGLPLGLAPEVLRLADVERRRWEILSPSSLLRVCNTWGMKNIEEECSSGKKKNI